MVAGQSCKRRVNCASHRSQAKAVSSTGTHCMCRHTLHRTFVHRATVSNSPMAAKDRPRSQDHYPFDPRDPMFFWFRTGVFSATSHIDEERLRPISVSGGDYPADNGATSVDVLHEAPLRPISQLPARHLCQPCE